MSNNSDSGVPCHVLLITSDILLRQLTAGLLKMEGHTCSSVATTEDALSQLAAREFDAVLLDSNAVGIALLELAQQISTCSEATLIVVGESLAEDTKLKLAEHGCRSFLASPIQPPALYAALNRRDGAADGRPQVTVDLEMARNQLSGDSDELRELVEIMIGEAPRFLAGIERGLANSQAADVEREAHSLKGAARVFGSEEVVSLAYRLERLAHEEKLDQAAILLPQLSELTQMLLNSLESAMADL